VRIRREDVEAVRERSRIDEIVGEHVALRPAGVGALKGLCPFHDEKTPSFNVRPTVGFYKCFGCDKGGDVISFVMEIDHLTFAEAVERLAARLGMELRYEDDGNESGRPGREGVNQRRRMLEANRAAAQFYAEQLGTSPDASIGRQFLVDRGFDQAAAEHFGVGFAPRGGEVLTRHLQGRGFTGEELVAAGLSGQGRRGLYDRFRGRLIWPIRDVTGDTLGFGARRLFDDDSIAAKYLNTPETALYKKSHVLYGVDLAKREIAKSHQTVVVEGYTDVMACHLAGEPTAVATCGTAFGADHIRIVRRLIGDDRNSGGRVIFTFDGDEAGQKAALRAFEDDQKFVAQTFIALAPGGMDPCDLRQQRGNEAVRELIAGRRPMFEFKIRSIMNQVDLSTAEGRVQGLRLAAPVVAAIRDPALRPEYARELAMWLGMEVDPVNRAVNRALRELRSAASGGVGTAPERRGTPAPQGAASSQEQAAADAEPAAAQGVPGRVARRPRPVLEPPRQDDPIAAVERQALECMLQVPRLVPPVDADELSGAAFAVPAYRAVHDAIRAAGGMAVATGMAGPAWVTMVQDYAPDAVVAMITELAVAQLPADREDELAKYAASVVLKVAETALVHRIGDLRSRVQRMGPDEDSSTVFAELIAAENDRRLLRDRINGNT